MTTVVKDNATIALSPAIRKRSGIAPGDHVEITAIGGVITIVSKSPVSDEYTPAQRRKIDAQLSEAEKGPFHGPFSSGTDLAAYIRAHKQTGQPKSKKTG